MASANSEFPRYVYVPWVDGVSHADRPAAVVQLGQAVSAETRLQLIGVKVTKNQLPDDWGKAGIPHAEVVSRWRPW